MTRCGEGKQMTPRKNLPIHDLETGEARSLLLRYSRLANPEDRYASFDYCYNYFRQFAVETTKSPNSEEFLERSLFHLGFYLASWGMLRGSTYLSKQSVIGLKTTIEALSNCPAIAWTCDVENYESEEVISAILGSRDVIKESFQRFHASETLVTKVMLGVFGCVPAFDTYFKRATGLTALSRSSLSEIYTYFQRNRALITEGQRQTTDLTSGRPSSFKYSQAKVIDMIFFTKGQ